MTSLKLRVLAPLVLCFFLLFLVALVGIYTLEKHYLSDHLSFVAQAARNHFSMTVQDQTRKLGVALSLIKNDRPLLNELEAGNRNALLERMQPVFTQLHNEYGISHFYFHNNKRINVLRVHQPNRFNDTIDRFTTMEAERGGRMTHGLELGPLGTFTLRVVEPVFRDKRLIGYLELGEEIDALMLGFKEMAQVELYTFINKKYLNRTEWQQGMAMLSRPDNWEQLPDKVLISKTLRAMPNEVKRIVAEGERNINPVDAMVRINQRDFSYWFMPLKDVGNREVGTLLLLHDINDELAGTEAGIRRLGLIFFIMTLLLSGLFYLILGRVERRIEATQQKLVKGAQQSETLQARHVEELKQEIENHKKTSETLAETNARLAHLLTASPVVIYSCEPKGQYAATFVSENIQHILGFSAQKFVGDPGFWAAHLHPDDRERVFSGLSNVFDNGVYEHEYRYLNMDGAYHWMRDGLRLLRDENGEPLEIIGYMVDINEKKQAETAVINAEKRLSLHFQQTSLGVIEWNENFEVIAWNPAAEKIFGYSAQQAIGSVAEEIIVPSTETEQVNQMWQDLLQKNGGTRSSNLNITKDGRHIYCEWHNTSLVDNDGKMIGIASQVKDITERKASEIRILQANRALKVLSECNEALVHAESVEKLHQDICRILVDSANYTIAWIGTAENDPDKTVSVAAAAGEQSDYLDKVIVRWGDDDYGRGPSGTAIRTGHIQVTNIQEDPDYALWREDATRHGFQAKISIPLKRNDVAFGCLTIYSIKSDIFDENEVELLKQLAHDLSYGIQSLRNIEERNEAQQALTNSLLDTVRAIALTVEKRDPYTSGHQNRVAKLAVGIASKMGLDENKIEGIRLGATIHDMGKIYIPAEILNRPGKLTEHEFGMIKSHPQVGYDIISDVHFQWPVKEMILQHHERMDGTGYPQGLKASEIILEAKIIAVADVVEAVTSHRPYRPALGIDKGLDEIRRGAGTHYDKDVVDACIGLFEQDGFEWE